MLRLTLPLIVSSLFLALVGLTPSTASAQPSSREHQPLPGAATLAAMPTDAIEVARAMETAAIGSPIVMRGRIAMDKNAFAADRAEFTLSDDAAVAKCCPRDDSLMDNCTIPDSHKATVVLVDARGRPLRTPLSGKGGLRPGAEVFVVGKAASTGDRLVVHATGIHVPRGSMPAGFFLTEPPEGAKDLSEAKKTGGLKKGDKVVLRGVIGGSSNPFVAERAIFTLMGSALEPCNANPDDHCARPWDYCCETRSDIAANSATIRVVDARGQPLRTDFKGRRGIRELSEVVVVGTVATAENDVLIIEASALHVSRP